MITISFTYLFIWKKTEHLWFSMWSSGVFSLEKTPPKLAM